MNPIQPLGGQIDQSSYLQQALAKLKQAGGLAPDASGGVAGGLADALLSADTKSKGDQASYAASPQGQIDPGAGPLSFGDQLKNAAAQFGGLFGLGASRL